jgi:hypothetical protein
MPAMAVRGYGRVINIASVHGLVASSTRRLMWRQIRAGGAQQGRGAGIRGGGQQGEGRRDGELHLPRAGRRPRSSSRRSRPARLSSWRRSRQGHRRPAGRKAAVPPDLGPVRDRRAGALALRAGGPQRHRYGDPDRRRLDGAITFRGGARQSRSSFSRRSRRPHCVFRNRNPAKTVPTAS